MPKTSEIELESTYLAAFLPNGLDACRRVDIEDYYFPASEAMPRLRIRRKDNSYQFTKKTPIGGDVGHQAEEHIEINASEYNALKKGDGRGVAKTRYLFPHGDLVAEVDLFRGALAGLCVVEFEFSSQTEKDAFVTPNFCLADVTHEDFIAGEALAGRSYQDIESELRRLGYSPISG